MEGDGGQMTRPGKRLILGFILAEIRDNSRPTDSLNHKMRSIINRSRHGGDVYALSWMEINLEWENRRNGNSDPDIDQFIRNLHSACKIRVPVQPRADQQQEQGTELQSEQGMEQGPGLQSEQGPELQSEQRLGAGNDPELEQGPGEQQVPVVANFLVPDLKRGEPGTEPLSPSLQKKFEELLDKKMLSPQFWASCIVSLTRPMVEEANPMMEFHPANSGSLNVSKAKIQKREMFPYSKGCGPHKKNFEKMVKKFNRGEYFAPLQNGEIAVAPDDVVAKSVGLDADTPVDMYFRLAKEMCLRMQHNETLGMSRKKYSHWFDPGYVGGGGAPYPGGAISKKRYVPSGKPRGRPRGKKQRSRGGEGGSSSGDVVDSNDE